MIKNFKEYKEFIKSDLYRYWAGTTIKIFIKSYVKVPGFRYMFWLRTASYFWPRNKVIGVISIIIWRRLSFKFGIQIPFRTNIAKGFYIGHFSCIVVSPDAIIGKNVNISQGVTIGKTTRGKNAGAAIISDEVYIGPGAKIVGAVKIGKNVAIGANAVVTRDVPDNAVVGGVPAKIISMDGAEGYINNKV